MKEFFQNIDFGRVLLALLILAMTTWAARWLTREGERASRRYVRHRHTIMNASAIARFAAYIAGIALAATTMFSFSKEALFASAGALALTLGLSLQDLAKSLIGGITILIDRPFQVGDRVQYKEFYGDVVEIGLRAVRLRTLDDSIVSIPNNLFVQDAVSSANAGALDMMVVIPFWIDPDSPIALAKRLVREAVVTSKYAFLAKPVSIKVKDALVDVVFTTQITAKAYVFNTRYETDFVSDVTERAKEAFRTHGIRCAVQPREDTRLYVQDEVA